MMFAEVEHTVVVEMVPAGCIGRKDSKRGPRRTLGRAGQLPKYKLVGEAFPGTDKKGLRTCS